MAATVGSGVTALIVLNFFMADVRDGLGPYLAALLQTEGWDTAAIGLAMTAGGIVGMLATVPAGAWVDATRHKRTVLVAASVLVTGGCLLLLWSTSTAVVGLSQLAIPLAGAVIPPAIAGISLGIVGPKAFDRQLGGNEAANHTGNVVSATLGGAAAWFIGIVGVLLVQAAMTVGAIVATLAIPPKSIDHARARGQASDTTAPEKFTDLLRSGPLLVFALTMGFFHLGNAAMLPLVGLQLGADGGSAGFWLSAAIVIAQLTMIPMALLTARVAGSRGYRPIVVAALLVLPIRAACAALLPPFWSIVPVQILDGVGAGLLGVATPGMVARIMAGTGRFNAGLGAVMTLQGVGAALSPALGGWVADKFGYPIAFGVLGAIAFLAIPLFIGVGNGTAEPALAAASSD
ncbi:MAG: MFS transporter [Geminicoccaceae bacterium]